MSKPTKGRSSWANEMLPNAVPSHIKHADMICVAESIPEPGVSSAAPAGLDVSLESAVGELAVLGWSGEQRCDLKLAQQTERPGPHLVVALQGLLMATSSQDPPRPDSVES
ncbi:hypothetical protein EYF80_024990 [Liparis tanakae]|uniref:Uncharacterized protein n=1 Tax=Liparis tanakae TaxID=230148 RepID=A0A4Z2HHQ6_9TELE|nr:hypothetical protein EYF80_024990 [Liparis tanakae]